MKEDIPGIEQNNIIVDPIIASHYMPINSAKKAGQGFNKHTDSPSSPKGILREMRVAMNRETPSDKYVLGHDNS